MKEFVVKSQSLVTEGNYVEALRICRVGLLADPNSLLGRLVMAQALLGLDRPEDAILEVRRVLDQQATNGDALTIEGEIFLHQGKPAKALASLELAKDTGASSGKLTGLLQETKLALASQKSASEPLTEQLDIGDISVLNPVRRMMDEAKAQRSDFDGADSDRTAVATSNPALEAFRQKHLRQQDTADSVRRTVGTSDRRGSGSSTSSSGSSGSRRAFDPLGTIEETANSERASSSVSKKPKGGRFQKIADSFSSKEKVSQVDGQTSAAKPWGGKKGYLLLGVVGCAVILFAVLKISSLRHQKKLDAIAASVSSLLQKDTLPQVEQATELCQQGLAIVDNAETQGLCALSFAVLSAEYGASYDNAKKFVLATQGLRSKDAMAARAYYALADGNVEDALREAENLLDNYPDETYGHYLLGKSYLLAEKPDVAIGHFQKAVRTQRPSVYAALGQAYADAGKRVEARVTLQNAVDLEPNYIAARLSLIELGLKGTPEQTTIAMDSLVSVNPVTLSPKDQVRFHLIKAEAFQATGDSQTAHKNLALAQSASDVRDYASQMFILATTVSLGLTDKGYEVAQSMTTRWPERMAPKNQLASLLLLRSEPAKVLDVYKDSAVESDALALTFRGLAWLRLDDTQKAERDISAAKIVDGALVETKLATAELSLARGDAKGSLVLLGEVDPKYLDSKAHLVKASALRQTGELKKARTELDALRVNDPSPEMYFEIARLERADGKYSAAEAAYDSALKMGAEKSVVALERASLAFVIGDSKRALELSQEIADTTSDAQVVLAVAHYATDVHDFATTKKMLERAKSVSAASALIKKERGRMYIVTQDFVGARYELTEAEKRQPEDLEISTLLFEALVKLGDEAGVEARAKMLQRKMENTLGALLIEARLLIFQGDTVVALRKLAEVQKRKRFLRATPREQSQVYYLQGLAHYTEGATASAIASLEKALLESPKNFDTILLYARSLVDKQSHGLATKQFELLVSLDNSRADIYFELGESAFRGKKWSVAKKAFSRVLEIDAESEEASLSRDYLLKIQ